MAEGFTDSSRISVLVLTTCSPDDRKTVAAVRALGTAGYLVTVGSDLHWGMAGASRFVQNLVCLPHPEEGLDAYGDAVLSFLEREPHQLVLPMNDYVVLALAHNRERLSKLAKLPLPPLASIELALDKERCNELAGSLGLRCPRTLVVDERQSLRDAVLEIGFPCLVKPVRGAGAFGLSILRRESDLGTERGGFNDLLHCSRRLVVQEYLVGQVHEAGLLIENGELVAACTQKRIYSYPPQAGAGILNETTWRPDLVDAAFELLKSLSWEGPAQVEFLIAEDEKPYFLEVNGRFWATLDLAIQAGVNFAVLAARPDSRPAKYQVGLKYRWPLPLGLLHALQTREAASFREFLLPAKNTVSDLWWSDPNPHLKELLFLLRRLLARRLRPLDARKRPWKRSFDASASHE